MASLRQLFLLASALPLATLTAAQTIVIDGKELPADGTTVSPAAELIDPNADLQSDSVQLTDAVLANLTMLELSNVTLFDFPADDGVFDKRTLGSLLKCKTYPGDILYPNKLVWKVFDLLVGGALIETVPIGAVCYKNHPAYNAAACEELLENWTLSETHSKHPTSVMSPLYQGQTCLPQDAENGGTCEIGGLPSYSVRADNVAQIQLAVNFARNLGLRLVVHNTGHDFLGKSTGSGALSIWTHNLKSSKYIKNFSSKSYKGPALKLGAGIQVGELYAIANELGVTAVGGECKGVGVTGGYLAGGGHSPLSGKLGMGSDQVLSIDIVTPNGRFITADETKNTDLFWALRGGGGGTFGVVTSMTVKVHPKMKFSGATWTVTAGPGTAITGDVFWAAVEAYWRYFPEFASKGTYGYSSIFGIGPGAYLWTMNPFMVPGASTAEFKAMVAPLLAEWEQIGFVIEPTWFEHDNFYDTWSTHFPTEAVGNTNLHTASRLFPAANWATEAKMNQTFATIRSVVDEGSALIHYNMNPAKPSGVPDSAVNPAWREAVMFGIFGGMWDASLAPEDVAALNTKITHDWMQRLRDITPGSGGYGNEGDVMEPNFQQAFYGSNYNRLLSIKRAVDPWDVFWAPTAVGSERWYVTNQEEWLTKQTGKLCRK